MSATSLDIITYYAAEIPELLSQCDVLDICVNPDGAMWVNRLGRGFSHESSMGGENAALLLSAISTEQNREFNAFNPILETFFPLTGDRIEGLTCPIVASAAFAVRTRPKAIYSLCDFARQGVLSRTRDPLNLKCHRAEFLDELESDSHLELVRLATRYRQNILLVGPTGSGKTTFGNALIADWLEQTPNDRVVIIEDTPELQCSLPNHVALCTADGVNEARLLKTALRLIPKRIVLGEVRSSEAAKVLLEAWNTGHSGGLATIHADDALAGLRKLETFLGSHDGVVRERIAAAVGVVIFIDGDERVPAGRKVREVVAVRGYDLERQDYELLHL